MAKLTLSDISNPLTSAATHNANNDALVAAFDNTLSRDGSAPNQMNANLDMNGFEVLNMGNASIVDNVVTYARTPAEVTAGVTPSNYQYMPYELRRYGAIVDGTTNDGGAVRNWILAASQAGAVATYEGDSGTALCTSFTAIDTTNAVRIHAPGLTIKGPASATDFCRPGGTLYCEGVTFDRWRSVFERETAETGTITDFRLISNTFQNCTGLVINIERPISNYVIEGNRFDSCSGGYAIKIGANTYASQDTWLKGRIARNIFTTLSASSTTSCAAGLIYGREITIEGNIVDGVAATSGEGWGFYTKARYANITGNLIRNVDSTSNADIVAINIKGAGRGVTSGPQGFAVVCSGNVIYNIGTAGTDGGGIRAQTDDVTITDNIVEDAGIHGITADEAAGSTNIKIAHNKILFSSSTGRTGIYFATGGSGHAVFGNIVRGANVGVSIRTGSTAVGSNYDFRDNKLEGVTAALDINTPMALDNVRIIGNELIAGARGVLNSNGAGAITNLSIYDNDFNAATTAQLGGTMPVGTYIRQRNKVQTTDGTSTSGVIFTLADEAAWFVKARILGQQSDGSEQAAYYKAALIYRNGGGAATVQGSVASVITDIESTGAAADWGATTIAVTGNAVRALLIGKAATTINWAIELEAIGA